MFHEFHAVASGRLDAAVGDDTDQNDLLNAALFELQIEVRIGKTALRPMFLDDNVTVLGAELGIELAAPGSNLERFRRQARLLKHVDVLPIIEIVRMRPVMR